jgi:hypothetical protein
MYSFKKCLNTFKKSHGRYNDLIYPYNLSLGHMLPDMFHNNYSEAVFDTDLDTVITVYLIWKRAHGVCDRSTGGAYFSMAPDPTSDIFRGPWTPILRFVFPIGLTRLNTVRYFCHFMYIFNVSIKMCYKTQMPPKEANSRVGHHRQHPRSRFQNLRVQYKGLVKRNIHMKYKSPITYHSKYMTKLKFLKSGSNFKVKVRMSNIIVLLEHSCHKEQAYKIWKPYHLSFQRSSKS